MARTAARLMEGRGPGLPWLPILPSSCFPNYVSLSLIDSHDATLLRAYPLMHGDFLQGVLCRHCRLFGRIPRNRFGGDNGFGGDLQKHISDKQGLDYVHK